MPQDDYVIEKGDTLSRIADLYDTTVPELMATNKIENPDRIYPGKKIMLPPPPTPERNPSFSYQQDTRNARLRQSPYTPQSSTEMEGRLQTAALPPMEAVPGEMVEKDDGEFHRFAFLPLGGVPGSGELELAWPKPVYDAFAGFQKVMSGEVEPYIINPETGKQEINPEMIDIGNAIAMVSMTGGLAGTARAAAFKFTPEQELALIKRAAQVAKKEKKTLKLGESSRIRMEREDVDDLAFMKNVPEKEFTLSSGIVIEFPGGGKGVSKRDDLTAKMSRMGVKDPEKMLDLLIKNPDLKPSSFFWRGDKTKKGLMPEEEKLSREVTGFVNAARREGAVDEVSRFNELFQKTTNRTPEEQTEYVALAQKFMQAKDMPTETVAREFATDLEKYGDALIRQRAGEKGFQFKAPSESQVLDFTDTRKSIHDFAKANKMTVDEVLAIFRKPNET